MSHPDYRTLHVRLSRAAHTRARIAALESDLPFHDYLDRLLRTASPITPGTPHLTGSAADPTSTTGNESNLDT